jgi:hypothetical protein
VYYIYEPPNQDMPTIHEGNCSHCRHGQGQKKINGYKLTMSNAKCQPGWSELPSITADNVLNKVRRERVRLCGHCHTRLGLRGQRP